MFFVLILAPKPRIAALVQVVLGFAQVGATYSKSGKEENGRESRQGKKRNIVTSNHNTNTNTNAKRLMYTDYGIGSTWNPYADFRKPRRYD